MVFPQLNQNANPPPAASVSPSAPMPAATGTMPNNEPRRIKTLAVKGDAADNGGVPAGASAPPKPADAKRSCLRRGSWSRSYCPPARNPASANASANTPMSLAPQAGQAPDAAPPARVAVDQSDPDGRSDQWRAIWFRSRRRRTRPTRRLRYRSLQGKFPSVLGSRSPLDQAGRSRRKGRPVPRLGRPVRPRPRRRRRSAAA